MRLLFYSIFYCLIVYISCRKWTIEDLSSHIKSWNYLHDPEELISDKNLGAKVNENYLKINKIYEKTDINFFVLSDISEQYVYKPKDFLRDLYQSMEVNESIIIKDKKVHHLFILILTKRNELIIFLSSDNLKKLISNDQINKIQLEMKQVIESKNYAKAVMYTFERLQVVWKKFTVVQHKQKESKAKASRSNSNHGGNSTLMDLLYIIPSIGVLGLFVLVCIRRRKMKNQINKID